MKPINWAGSSYEDLRDFPAVAKRAAGFQLHLLQEGLDPLDWKPMPAIGPGVREIRIHEGGAYRVIYLAKYQEAVYVLHAFVKKTQRTRQQDIELARTRLREIEAHRRRR